VTAMYHQYGLVADKHVLEAGGVNSDLIGNFCPMPRIIPDQLAPVARNVATKGRVLMMMRWGFPNPSSKNYVTEIRNTLGDWWKPWLQNPQNRCLVPATSFSTLDPDCPANSRTWYARNEAQSLMWIAGIWREWEGTRGSSDEAVTGRHQLFSLLTVNGGATIKPDGPANQPMLLMEEDDREMWLNAPLATALTLQRPMPDSHFRQVIGQPD
jgi:putative SOS response-associated peptidase YedK